MMAARDIDAVIARVDEQGASSGGGWWICWNNSFKITT